MDIKPELKKFTEVKGLKDQKLISYSIFIIWPIIAVIAISAGIYKLLYLLISKKKITFYSLKNYYSLILLPYYLIRSSLNQKELTTILAIILLLPFMLGTLISPILLFSDKNTQIEIDSRSPQPPKLFNMFHDSGEGLFGTNGQGEGIAQLIFKGTGQIYVLTFFTVLFVVILGLWLGKLTYNQKIEPFIMGFSEILESIPIFFLLLVVLSIFGWFEATLKESGILMKFFFDAFVILIIAVLMGLSFLPRLIRLIRERIKTFSSENFIDSNKALGIKQDKILWYHIIRKNCIDDIILFISQIWASIILLELSMDYLVSIFPVLGARIYSGWAQMLLSSETVRAILFLKELDFQNWWLYFFPIFFIISTVTGFFIYGESLKRINDETDIGIENINEIPYHLFIQNLFK